MSKRASAVLVGRASPASVTNWRNVTGWMGIEPTRTRPGCRSDRSQASHRLEARGPHHTCAAVDNSFELCYSALGKRRPSSGAPSRLDHLGATRKNNEETSNASVSAFPGCGNARAEH